VVKLGEHIGARIDGQRDPLGAIQDELETLWSIHPQVPD
jgi:hypothetical protein